MPSDRQPSPSVILAVTVTVLVGLIGLLLIFASGNANGFVYGSAFILITVGVFGTPLFALIFALIRWKWRGERPNRMLLGFVIVWLVLDILLVLLVVAFLALVGHIGPNT